MHVLKRIAWRNSGVRGVGVILMGLVLACQPSQRDTAAVKTQNLPEEPYVIQGMCPFECCEYGTWTADAPLTAHREEGRPDEVLFSLPEGATFDALRGNVHVTQIGMVHVLHPVTLRNSISDGVENPRDSAQLASGDTVYVLTYVGEGYYHLWHDGQVYGEERFWGVGRASASRSGGPMAGELLRDPTTEWWVQVRSSNGATGWLLMDETVRVIGAGGCE